MQVAVLLTGALRTIRKTIRYLKQNVLLPTGAKVFACCQNDTDQSNEEWASWLANEIGPFLQAIQWFDPGDPLWCAVRERQLSCMQIGASTQHYLRTSGSMIEYYQLQLAYAAMTQCEFQSECKYEYIVRVRTDTIFAHPVDFHWLHWTEQEVADRVALLKQQAPTATDQDITTLFMSSLLSDASLCNVANFTGSYLPSRDPLPLVSDLRRYLSMGAYILTFRKNLLYIARRDLFHLIPALGTMFGLVTSPSTNHHFRWNAESQFQAACYHSNLAIFDYCTVLEDQSLYSYEEQRYFDADGNLVSPLILFCLVRK